MRTSTSGPPFPRGLAAPAKCCIFSHVIEGSLWTSDAARHLYCRGVRVAIRTAQSGHSKRPPVRQCSVTEAAMHRREPRTHRGYQRQFRQHRLLRDHSGRRQAPRAGSRPSRPAASKACRSSLPTPAPVKAESASSCATSAASPTSSNGSWPTRKGAKSRRPPA